MNHTIITTSVQLPKHQRRDTVSTSTSTTSTSMCFGNGTVVLSHRTLTLLGCAITYLFCLQCVSLYTLHKHYHVLFPKTDKSDNEMLLVPMQLSMISNSRSSVSSPAIAIAEQNRINSLRLHSTNITKDFVCRWYVAESAIPNSGLGIYTGIGLHKDEDIGYPDICLYVNDGDFDATHLFSHTWGANYFGTIEGKGTRSACEGLVTIANTAHPALINTALISQEIQTNAGLHRRTSPGAGAISHNYGIQGRAHDIITAGSELIVDYFDWDFSHITEPVTPKRDLQWLQQHGWCVDKMDIRPSTLPQAGRGAFSRIFIEQGEVVTPAPLQAFRDRDLFQTIQPEQLMINYCLQAADSTLVFFPYGQGVNLINHSSKQPNVEWRWSTKVGNIHHPQWLDLSLQEFWKVATPGGLILEIVALRDIQPDEEIFIDYGSAWEEAWEAHVAQWKPPMNAHQYVYPAEMDETEQLRTVQEQSTDPYPPNIATVCVTPDYHRKHKNQITWYEPESWWDKMTLCHILSRRTEKRTGYVTYDVSLIFSNDPADYVYDPTIKTKDLYIDIKVPRRAIRFIDIPYMNDEHLPNVFRHPIGFPDHLVPESWRNNEYEAA
jgi:SET domain